MSSSKIPSPTRRALALGGAASLLLAACGGGGDSQGAVDDGTPDYGGRNIPGTVQLMVTHQVTITVTMPDLTGVADPTKVDLSTLPVVTKTINVGLDSHHAPLSTNNFLAYLASGAYTNTIFHRVIPKTEQRAGSTVPAIVQGGGYTDTNGTATHIATNAAIGLESRNGLSNTQGTLAMARTGDPNSATSEFYFNLADNSKQLGIVDGQLAFLPFLDYADADNPGFAVFGTVLDQDSLGTLLAIAKIPTSGGGNTSAPDDWPTADITITAIVRTS